MDSYNEWDMEWNGMGIVDDYFEWFKQCWCLFFHILISISKLIYLGVIYNAWID
jgi:hypothetical protein